MQTLYSTVWGTLGRICSPVNLTEARTAGSPDVTSGCVHSKQNAVVHEPDNYLNTAVLSFSNSRFSEATDFSSSSSSTADIRVFLAGQCFKRNILSTSCAAANQEDVIMSTGGVNVCLGTLHLIRRSPSQNVLYRPEQVKFSPRLQVGLIPPHDKSAPQRPGEISLCGDDTMQSSQPFKSTETEWQRFLRYHTMWNVRKTTDT